MNKTPEETKDKLFQSIRALEHALTFAGKIEADPFYFSGIAKSFEICMEYAWKHLRKKVLEEGLEAMSPKEAIKRAGQVGFIQDVEKWLTFLNDRNLAVHDYLGLTNEEYLATIRRFLVEVKRLRQT